MGYIGQAFKKTEIIVCYDMSVRLFYENAQTEFELNSNLISTSLNMMSAHYGNSRVLPNARFHRGFIWVFPICYSHNENFKLRSSCYPILLTCLCRIFSPINFHSVTRIYRLSNIDKFLLLMFSREVLNDLFLQISILRTTVPG